MATATIFEAKTKLSELIKIAQSGETVIITSGRGKTPVARLEILVSAVSAWEVATKVRIGNMPEAEWLERDFLSAVGDAGFELMPISVEEALRAGRLPGRHGDPFDRMLAAQALSLDIPIVSKDAKLDSFGARRIW